MKKTIRQNGTLTHPDGMQERVVVETQFDDQIHRVTQRIMRRVEPTMKKDLLAGFRHPADAIVPCSACGATEGVPCKSIAKDKDRLKPGFVHFGRRLRRFLLTGAARGDQRKRFEDEAVKMLRKWLAERQPS